MRVGSIQRPSYSGGALIAVGGLFLALALGLLIAGSGSNEADRTGSVSADAGAVTKEVIAFWEERVKSDPGDFVAYNKLAQAYIQRARESGDVADYSRAEAAVNASLKALPGDNQTAVALLASIQATKHQFGEALKSAQAAIALDPGDPFAYAVLGDALLALGRYEEAYDAYLYTTTIAPGLSSFSRLAYLLELRGALKGAEAQWRNALDTDSRRRPENTAWAQVQRGHFYFNSGDLDAAQGQYERSLEAFPDYVHGLAGLAKVKAAAGDYDEAISLYSQVAARYPAPEYVAALGDVYRAAGRAEEASKQYELVDAIDRLYKANGVNTDLQMALYFADHDLNLEEAVRQAGAVYDQRPSIQAADVLAWALYKSARYEEARTYSQEALRLGTLDASIFFHAGMIDYRLGDYEQARGHLEKATEINPQFSVLYSAVAADTLRELRSLVGGQP